MDNYDDTIKVSSEGTKKVIVKKMGVMSVAKVQALLMAFMGLIFGLLFGLIGGAIGSAFGVPAFGGGFSMIIIMPIMYGIFGFIFGAIGAALYNMVSKWIGGIEMDLEMTDSINEYGF